MLANDEVTVLLRSYQPWLRTVAANALASRPAWIEDLAQEGLIALWLAYRDFDPSRGTPLDYWLKFKARGAMLQVIRNVGAQKRDTQREVLTGDARLLDVRVALPIERDVVADERVLRAVRGLARRQREYAFLRFWCGWREPELVEHFGYGPSGIWRLLKRNTLRTLAPTS